MRDNPVVSSLAPSMLPVAQPWAKCPVAGPCSHLPIPVRPNPSLCKTLHRDIRGCVEILSSCTKNMETWKYGGRLLLCFLESFLPTQHSVVPWLPVFISLYKKTHPPENFFLAIVISPTQLMRGWEGGYTRQKVCVCGGGIGQRMSGILLHQSPHYSPKTGSHT